MFFVSISFFFTAILISVLIAYDTKRPDYYDFLWLLPLAHSLIVMGISYLYPSAWENRCFLIIIAAFSVRNLFTPLFMYLGEYQGYFHLLTNGNVNKAILLMLYETLVIVLFTVYKAQKSNTISYLPIKLGNCALAKTLFVFFIVLFLAIFFVRRDFYSGFNTILNTQELRTATTEDSAIGAAFTVFSILFPVGYLFCGLYLLNLINQRKKSISRLVLNILVICIPLLFMNNGDGFTIICLISLAITSVKIGGISRRQFYIFGSVLVVGITLLLFGLMNGGQNYSMFVTLSKNMQAYFPGVCNFAGYYNIGRHDKLLSLFYDIYYTIPFRNTLIGIPGDYRLVMLYTADNNARSQIIPCFIQLYYYFGFFAPCIECIFIHFAFKNYDNAKSRTSVFTYFTNVMTWIYLILTPVMYNFTIFMSRFLTTIIVLHFLSLFVERKMFQYFEVEVGDLI